ncbi:MAG: fibronectin type III domain-containing protein [Pseudomonadota bacterium]
MKRIPAMLALLSALVFVGCGRDGPNNKHIDPKTGLTPTPTATATAEPTATATPTVSPPAAPTGLTATATSSVEILLQWSDISNETGYRVYRQSGSSWVIIKDNLAANTVAFTNSGLTALTTYVYAVAAFNAGGESSRSLPATATTTSVAPTIPAAPTTLVVASTTDTTVKLNWTDNSNNESEFHVYRDGALVSALTVATNVTTVTDTGRTPNTTYSYLVKAYNAAGESSASNTVSPKTLLSIPQAPTSLTATAYSNTQIQLHWVDNADNESGFTVYFQNGSVAKAINTANTVDTIIDGLTASTSYTFYVIARNDAGPSNASNNATATTNPNPNPLGAPYALRATPGTRMIVLEWSFDGSRTGVEFIIERWQGNYLAPGAVPDYQPLPTTVTDLTYLNTNLPDNTWYSYRVRAKRGAELSTYSNQNSGVTDCPLCVPTDPTNFTVTPRTSGGGFTFQWTDNSINELRFQIFYRVHATVEPAFEPLGSPDSTTSTTRGTVYSWIDPWATYDFTPGIHYDFRIQAEGNSGTSDGLIVENVVAPSP